MPRLPRLRCIFLCFLLGLWITPAHAIRHEFNPWFFLKAMNYAQGLMQRCPPEACFILNFGPTAALTSAYFRSRLPTQEERDDYYAELMARGLRSLRMDREADRETWFALFDRILPAPERLRGRKLVIHRTLWLGHTMEALGQALQAYRRERRPDLVLSAELIVDAAEHAAEPLRLLRPFQDPRVHVDARFTGAMLEYIYSGSGHEAEFPTQALLDFADTRIANSPKEILEGRIGLPNPFRKELEDIRQGRDFLMLQAAPGCPSELRSRQLRPEPWQRAADAAQKLPASRYSPNTPRSVSQIS